MGNCFCNPKNVVDDVKKRKRFRPTDDIPYTYVSFQEEEDFIRSSSQNDIDKAYTIDI
mgnify:CR=1